MIRRGWVSQGEVTRKFETMLAQYCSAKHAIVVNNGSSAILSALLAHGVKAGDTILVPDYTHIATANIPKLLGCHVSLVDISSDTFNVNYVALERVVRRHRPKFVVVVDVAGLPNDMSILSDLAEQYEFILVEDAAESMGGEYKRRRVGSHGHTVTLSFHAAKQLTTVEGGAVLTDNPTIANRCRIIRNHGEVPRRKYVSRLVGGNFRTTDLQSAIGIAQLRKLDKYLTRRNEIVRQYREELSKLFRFQVVPSYVTKHAYMMFMTISRSNRIRNNLQQHLEKRGIETRVPWPPLHRQAQFRTVDTAFHESSRLYEKVLSLPLYNTMRDSDVERVVSEVLASNMH